ncbi:FxsA family protein [Luminiphilus sp.]|nr:FxsA family protein [Luminiphilus sp.]
MRWLLFLYPWLELWSLIQLGIETSPGLALMWVLGALVMGSALMRWAGRSSLQRLAQASAGGTLPEQLLMADFALILSGLLLAIPGLVSDLLAVLILIKPLRHLAAIVLASRVAASTFHTGANGRQEDIIEGEFSVTEATGHLEHLSDREPPDDQK